MVFFKGMGIGAGLIVAIGAQNAFVLSQSIKRNHHLVVALICILADIILIATGVGGVGTLVVSNGVLSTAAAWAGSVFLTWYGLSSLHQAWRGGSLQAAQGQEHGLKKVVLTTLAVTFFNPHVYLDTVIMLGSISASFDPHRLEFALGAMSASVLWFLILSLGGQAAAVFFNSQKSWQLLDTGLGIIMLSMAFSLVAGG